MFRNGSMGLELLTNKIHNSKQRIQNGDVPDKCPAHNDMAEGLVTLLEVAEYQLKKSVSGLHINWKVASALGTCIVAVLLGIGWYFNAEVKSLQITVQPQRIEQTVEDKVKGQIGAIMEELEKIQEGIDVDVP